MEKPTCPACGKPIKTYKDSMPSWSLTKGQSYYHDECWFRLYPTTFSNIRGGLGRLNPSENLVAMSLFLVIGFLVVASALLRGMWIEAGIVSLVVIAFEYWSYQKWIALKTWWAAVEKEKQDKSGAGSRR
ncbi:Uncharacterised protein [uncultured archaeon]|nr:Uncharacterised protein [uncultured archaeon]